jgi:hypothetical protein
MNKKTIIGVAISIGLIAGLASARRGGALATPQADDAPKPKPSASAPAKEKPKAPKPEQPKKPDEGGW